MRFHLQSAVLRSVSRSFYLSMRFLPRQLREPIAAAYLLARTTDTVADTAAIPNSARIEALEMLRTQIQGGASPQMTAGLIGSFVELQQNENERRLLNALPDCLRWLEHLEQADRNDVRHVLEKITRGQMLDLQRFNHPGEVRALATAAELDEYTYLVAGCVGEFWTRLCFRHIRNFADRSQEQMLTLGRRYGMGLQLINIVRDAGADLRAGRCYFPRCELDAAHLAASEILAQPECFQPVYRMWVAKAKAGLESGVEYSRAIRNRRVRGATVLPALIGARTLALLEEAGPRALQQIVKVPRSEVRGMILRLVAALAARRTIDAMFARAYRK